MKCPRCPCGAYVATYAHSIGHVCAAHEIAERIGYTYQAVSKYFAKLRREGREFPIGRDPYFDRGKKK